MRRNNRARRGISRLIMPSSLALAVMIGVSAVDAAEVTIDGPRAQLPGAFKDARIGDDPDIIPLDQGIADDAGPFGESVRMWNPMVACTVREIGEDPDPIPRVWWEIGDDPDPIPRIWWMSCSGIGDDPDSIPPTN